MSYSVGRLPVAATLLGLVCPVWLAACAGTPSSPVTAPRVETHEGEEPATPAIPACPDASRADEVPVLAWVRDSKGKLSTAWMEPGGAGSVERKRAAAAVVATVDGLHVLRTRLSEVIACEISHRCSAPGFPACPRPKIQSSQKLWTVLIGDPSQPTSIEALRPSRSGCPEWERSMWSFRGSFTLVAALGSTVFYEVERHERWGDPSQDRHDRTIKAYDLARQGATAIEIGPGSGDLSARWTGWQRCLSAGWKAGLRGAELVGVSPLPHGVDAAQLFSQFGSVTAHFPRAPPFRSRRGGKWCGFAGWGCPSGQRCVHDPALGCGPEDPGCAGQCEELPP